MVGERKPGAMPECLGRFRLKGQAGVGANAVIYAAWDEDNQRPVAIKLLRADRSARPD